MRSYASRTSRNVSATRRSSAARGAAGTAASRAANVCANLSGCHRSAAARKARLSARREEEALESSGELYTSKREGCKSASKLFEELFEELSLLRASESRVASESEFRKTLRSAKSRSAPELGNGAASADASSSRQNAHQRASCVRHRARRSASSAAADPTPRTPPRAAASTPAARMRAVSRARLSSAAASRVLRARVSASRGVRGTPTRVFLTSARAPETSRRARNAARSNSTAASSVAASTEAVAASRAASRARDATSADSGSMRDSH